jgi:D-alanyl-D-alanine carboxypeptidase
MKRKLFLAFAAIITLISAFSYLFMNPILVEAQMITSAECVMEANSRRILYQSYGDTRLPMASTTKIATAIAVLESGKDIEAVYCIPKCAVGVEGSSVYLQEGDEYSIKDLLYGLMLRSGNDCAVALATIVDGGIGAFTSRMNKVAQRAGAVQTVFQNPHGLPHKNHYTTAVDLSLITAYAMQNPTFCEIVATKYYAPRNWTNKNKMLTVCDGAIGVKTGYTKQAGRCLVSAAERNGMRLICTVLNCSDMYERSKRLLDDGFSKYHNREILRSGTTLAFDGGEGIVQETYAYPMMEGEEAQVEIVAKAHSSPKNKKIVGQFQIYLAKRLLFSGNLYKL